ncbi:hypothetical protein PENTCL1PPCAC_13128, partial [Pristionchus entomophagus]
LPSDPGARYFSWARNCRCWRVLDTADRRSHCGPTDSPESSSAPPQIPAAWAASAHDSAAAATAVLTTAANSPAALRREVVALPRDPRPSGMLLNYLAKCSFSWTSLP